MASNTKLTDSQKQAVKQWIKNNPTVEFFTNEKVTVLVKPEFKNSRMYIVALSTMSPNEKKFRPSVGKYHAINTREDGQYVLMDANTMQNFLDFNDMWG